VLAIFVSVMKRFIVSLVLLIYFAVSSGFVVSLHYCMNKLASTAIGHADEGSCGDCGMEKSDSHCCWDDVKLVKLQTDHFASKAFFAVTSPAIVATPIIEFLQTPFFNFSPLPIGYTDSSPPFHEQDIFLYNRVFRI
jgi:hypothetical protein